MSIIRVLSDPEEIAADFWIRTFLRGPTMGSPNQRLRTIIAERVRVATEFADEAESAKIGVPRLPPGDLIEVLLIVVWQRRFRDVWLAVARLDQRAFPA